MAIFLKPYVRNALRRLREPADLHRLSVLDDPELFIEELFLAAGRNLAVASGFLPEERRHEGKVAFLCCRVLDAHEDLNPRRDIAVQRIQETVDYLQGKREAPPPPPEERGSREADQMEYLAASRLPWLRQALAALPSARRDRVSALLADLARATIANPRGGFPGETVARYGEQVLGRVIRYSLDLMGIEVTDTVDLSPLGRLCQAVNDLRDLPDDAPGDVEVRRATLWLESAECAVSVTSVLRDLNFTRTPGARAATVYMAATTLKSVAVQAGYPLPWISRHPIGAARLTETVGAVYLRVLLQLDQEILGLAFHLARTWGNAEPSSVSVPTLRGSEQDAFESQLADRHPDPRVACLLKRSCRLLRYSILLTSNLPQVAVSRLPTDDVHGRLLMIGDYLMATAFSLMQQAGLSVLHEFSRTGAILAEELHARRKPIDPRGYFAAFLTEVVGAARGIPTERRERLCARNRNISRTLHFRDRRASLLQQLYHGLFG